MGQGKEPSRSATGGVQGAVVQSCCHTCPASHARQQPSLSLSRSRSRSLGFGSVTAPLRFRPTFLASLGAH